MEPGKELPITVPSADASVLLSPTPTNILHFPSSTLFPVVPAPAFGSIVSVPLVSQTFVQQPQISLQSEPLFLLPASTLSLAAPSNAVAPAPLLSTEIQPSSVLHTQQLHLNNAQMPFILKSTGSLLQMDQTLKTRLMSQQFIVLPVNGENTLPAAEKTADLQTISENKIIPGSENQGARKNGPYNRQSYSQKDKNSSAKMTTRNMKKNNNLATKYNIQEEKLTLNSTVNSCFNTSHTDLNKSGIVDVISSIPSNWQVVGVAGLNQSIFEELLLSSKHSSTLSSMLSAKPKVSPAEASHEMKNEAGLVKDTDHIPYDQPSLVSVNLNTASQPVASETVIDRWPTNELMYSVKMDDIPCTNIISIKSEYAENGENNLKSAMGDTEGKDNVVLTKDVESSSKICNTVALTSEPSPEAHVESSAASEINIASQKPWQIGSTLYDSSDSQSPFAEGKWTIIGVTSLPPPPTLTTVTASQAASRANFESVSEKKDDSVVSADILSTSNTTILKIPLTSTSALSPKQDKKVTSTSKIFSNVDKINSHTPAALNDDGVSSSDSNLPNKTKCEDLKWTIVGVMGSPLIEPSSLNPSASLASELLSNSCMAISSSVSSSRPDNGVNNSPLKVLPSSSSSTGLIPLSTSLNGQLLSEMHEKKKSVLREATKRSPKIGSSVNSDDINLIPACPPSESQWKIVGVTQLGIPPTPANALVSLSQLNPTSPVLSMPILIPAESSPLLSGTAAGTATIVTQTTETMPSSTFLSPLPMTPTLLPVPAPNMPFPVFSCHGSSTMTLSPPPSFVNPMSPPTVQMLQDIAQQQNLSQFIKSQLTACSNTISSFSQNDGNQWNVVGIVSNNQVSLLSPINSTPKVTNTGAAVAKPSLQDTGNHVSSAPLSQNTKPKENITRCDGKKMIKAVTTNKNGTIRQSLASKVEDSEKYNLKNKGHVNRHQQQEPSKIKKNTVSNLLRMKRMQQKSRENVTSSTKNQICDDLQDFAPASCPVPQKKPKTRSLRSYAGNRKIFTRNQSKTFNEKLNLRSGTQVPVDCSESENDQIAHIISVTPRSRNEDSMSESVEDVNVDQESSVVNVEAHSSSRRRKLKVPRKMVADLDYHPFDSSSDSN